MLALTAVAAWIVLVGLPQTAVGRAVALAIGVVTIVAGALLGKLLGIVVARMRYGGLTRSLERRTP